MAQPMATEILTLEEVADYLRLPLETVERQVVRGEIPGRRIADTWRFLRSAIDAWLSSYDSRTLLLQQAGALADDEHLAALRTAIYALRRRPEGESDAPAGH